jgi:hypothetical protein
MVKQRKHEALDKITILKNFLLPAALAPGRANLAKLPSQASLAFPAFYVAASMRIGEKNRAFFGHSGFLPGPKGSPHFRIRR